ncbi:hypothetical protein [Nitrospirillum amazonense]|uniref:hypothetical protein n=1 Tax=Nitrospirillum amazonense TaxID=28077 RepID=UPI002412C9F0|nr:hypothetical protein [Nitrospirillum amazonense]MDG3443712.1 hypothetical protein [Nitrospirillum amazonense]
MTTIVSLASFKQSRRVEEENSRRAAEAQATHDRKVDQTRLTLSTVLGTSDRGEQLAAVLAEALVTAGESKVSRAPKVAYCDPANETRGSKFEATRNLSHKEIAARIRQDIKDAQKAGRLPQTVKASVRFSLFSGGASVDVTINALPPGMVVWNPEYVAWVNQSRGAPNYRFAGKEMYSPEYGAVLSVLEAIHNAYNRDNSDSSSDYFDRRYYGDVRLSSEIRQESRRAEGFKGVGEFS